MHICECTRVRSRSHARPVINPCTHAHNSPLNCLVNGPIQRIKWKLFNATPGLIYPSYYFWHKLICTIYIYIYIHINLYIIYIYIYIYIYMRWTYSSTVYIVIIYKIKNRTRIDAADYVLLFTEEIFSS